MGRSRARGWRRPRDARERGARRRTQLVRLHEIDERVPGLGLAERDGDDAVVSLGPVAEPPPLHDLHPGLVLDGLARDVPVEHGEGPGLRADAGGGAREVHDAVLIQERLADVHGAAVETLGHLDGVRLARERRGLIAAQFLGGVARSAGDDQLADAARKLAHSRRNGTPSDLLAATARVGTLVQDRMQKRAAI